MNDLYVLEWSKKQNAFHIQSALSAVEHNLNLLLGGGESDYLVIMIGTRDECEVIRRRYRQRLTNEKDSLKSWQMYKRH